MKTRWTPEAVSNLEGISLRIAADNPEAARKTVNAIYKGIEELIVFPNRGRTGKLSGTRELVFAQLPHLAWSAGLALATAK